MITQKSIIPAESGLMEPLRQRNSIPVQGKRDCASLQSARICRDEWRAERGNLFGFYRFSTCWYFIHEIGQSGQLSDTRWMNIRWKSAVKLHVCKHLNKTPYSPIKKSRNLRGNNMEFRNSRSALLCRQNLITNVGLVNPTYKLFKD